MNFLIIALIVLVVFNLVSLITKKKNTKPRFYGFDRGAFLLTLSFSFLGFTIGLLVGLSQSAVVHVTIPALLTFYGGFLTYLFAKDSFTTEIARKTILISAIAVSVFLIYGVEIGAAEKSHAIKTQRENDMYFLDKEEAIKKRYR